MTTTPTAALVEEAERERTALSLELGTTEYLIAALRRAEAERDAAIARAVNAEQEQADMERLLEMQHERTRQADELWRKQHNKPLTSPDLGALIEWLMKRAEKAEAERDAQHAEVLRLTGELDALATKTGDVEWREDAAVKVVKMRGRQIAELTATRDLLTAENARLQARVATLELLRRGGK